METVYVYSFIASFSLLLGASIGIGVSKINQKIIAGMMAFGAGVLICALTFGLMQEAFNHGGFDSVIFGFLVGGLVFILGDYLLHLFGARIHKRKPWLVPGKDVEPTGSVITLGSILDNIPESIALGIALFAGGGKGLLLMIAIFLSNFPEAISSIPGLKREGFSNKKIIAVWLIAALTSFIIAILSYLFLDDLHLGIVGFLEAFAAGAILAMLASTMMPEAYEEGGMLTGMLTVFGFLVAFIISRF